jgi:hypothetical protein
MKHKITKWQTDTTTSPSPTVQVKWFQWNEVYKFWIKKVPSDDHVLAVPPIANLNHWIFDCSVNNTEHYTMKSNGQQLITVIQTWMRILSCRDTSERTKNKKFYFKNNIIYILNILTIHVSKLLYYNYYS